MRSSNCFLNVPYDMQFEKLFLAYLAGLAALGLTPRTALEIPGGKRRLDRILDLIRDCPYSIHDLSRTEVDRKPPRTPRFNMPFEVGLAVAIAHSRNGKDQNWFLFAGSIDKLKKSLSDLDGTDVYPHHRKIADVFRQLNNAFHRKGVSVRLMRRIYADLRDHRQTILKETGAYNIFEAGAFTKLVVLSKISLEKHVQRLIDI